MSQYLIGIDAGCTNSKVVIFDIYGNVKSCASTSSMRFKKRAPGFEEFDIDELWEQVQRCIKRAIKEAGIDQSEIKGIGVTSFGNGVVFLDENGGSIAPGCFSQDHRADCILEMYKKSGVYDQINSVVKGTLWAGEPGPILRWYKDYEREIYDKIGGVLLFKDFIMYRLTGVFATDLNCCGGSFLTDAQTQDYSYELMQLYGIEEMYDKLPKLATSPSEVVGTVTSEAAWLTGLCEGTPVVAGMMDILSCLVGSGATGDGVYTAIAGTWCINETHSRNIIPNASSNMPYIHKGEYLNCSYTGASGSNYEWFTRVLGDRPEMEAKEQNCSKYDILDKYISSVEPGSARVIFSPFVAQPSIHVNARANFLNIDMNTTYAELAYAVAEGVSFIHKYHTDFLKESGLPLSKIRFTGGIAKSKVWNQMFANVLRAPIEGIDCEETGALGVAIAAGIGCGIYESYEDAFEKAVKVKDVILPDESKFDILDKRYKEWSYINKVLTTYWDKK